MKLLLALILALVEAYAYADEPVVIPPEVVRACAAAGGCLTVTEKMLMEQIQKAFEAGAAAEAKKQKRCFKDQT